ncbi:MAG: haloalkane dehalogenase [Hyphomonas sp.]|uniref:haloalkane dehalogenase n=1 Tax=Hyphomonas sp. TaxID=87 RepID=UPI003529684C
MKILRTPDACFDRIKDYPFAPNYTAIRTADGSELRIHHLDEGPKTGSIVLCMHGQPAWSYLYRKMIPLLTSAGLRVIAPDLPGFGKSDKPAAREDYTYQSQVDWMNAWLSANDFKGLTLFGQDWGGAIGLRLVADQPDRFDRVVISNTGLPLPTELPDPVTQDVRAFLDSSRIPSLVEMGRALADMKGGNRAMQFAHWQKYCWGTEDLPTGLLMYIGTSHTSRLETGVQLALSRLGLGKIAKSPLRAAYDAPYPDPSFKMGPRAMPMRVPTLPTDPSMEAQWKAWAFFRSFEKPFLCAFSDGDPITRDGDSAFIDVVPGAKGQPHRIIKGGGHFIQEDAPEELSQTIVDFVRSASAEPFQPTQLPPAHETKP